MFYLTRSLEKNFLEFNYFFKVLLVTGARQVGKTTMLQHLIELEGKKRTYISLDDPNARQLAQMDPLLFFQTYPLPILIDEVQYAPELFSTIKLLVDQNDERGQVWLTGSQQFSMMKNVQESLAGRIGILTLYSMTKNEKDGIDFSEPLDFSFAQMQIRSKQVGENSLADIFSHIWRGGMPQIFGVSNQVLRAEYYNSYLNTYLMRDIMVLGGVRNAEQFIQFMQACAALTAEQLNIKTLSDISGIAQATAKEWLDILQGLNIVYLLRPYSNNELKRLAKTPKLYFFDTGLAAHLSKWTSAESLMMGAVNGHYFENYVVTEFIKSFAYSSKHINMTYYRDSNDKEIDLMLEYDNTIHPLEIKLSASPKRSEIRKFEFLDKLTLERGHGGVVCMAPKPMMIDERNSLIPANLI